MKKIAGLLTIITIAISLMVSCSDDGAPTGMKLVKGGDEVGYSFFVPEEWTVSNIGEVAMAHVSSVDTTSVSFAEVKAPDGGFKSASAAIQYFEADIPRFPYAITKSASEWGKECTFGNVDVAYKFVFTFEYSGVKYKSMQILVSYGDRSYIFTYQSSPELMSNDKSYYEYYYEKVALVIDEFLFTGKSASADKTPADPDGDGYYLASDKTLSGFELYLPIAYKCEISEGIVSAAVSDTASVSLVKATGTGVSVKEYYEQRKKAIESYAKDFEEVEVNKTEGVVLGNLTTAASYEYTYVYNGTAYRVYQIMGVDTFDGYVFTYTATDAAYNDYIDEVKDIIAKVVF